MNDAGYSLDGQASNVFLCHNTLDKPIVRRLGKLLDANGLKPWIDECSLDGGVRWQGELVNAMSAARAIVVCLGPHGLGPWQKSEIEIVVEERIKSGKIVIPLFLPTCGETVPEIPTWLRSVQTINLMRDESEVDPFAQLLASIDLRSSSGHYRPSVLLLRNGSDKTSDDVHQRVLNACYHLLHRVRVVDYSEMLLERKLRQCLPQTDVLISILASDSFDKKPDFQYGIATAAKQFSSDVGVKVIQWRSERMVLPDDRIVADRFRATDIETCLEHDLTRAVVSAADAKFEAPDPPESKGGSRKRAVLGIPLQDEKFAREISERLKQDRIRCDALVNWERLKNRLTSGKGYDALVVILNGDRDWRDECEECLDDLEFRHSERLPKVGAYCHRTENPEDAIPVPLDLDQFEEYFGKKDLSKLAQRINESGVLR